MPRTRPTERSPVRRRLAAATRLSILAGSLLLFVLAIELMKAGAAALGPFLQDDLQVSGFANGLGLGWLMSYLLLSGSPAASSGLALLGAGVLDRLAAFGTLVGSRFGASFIVLLLGLLYVLRGRDRSRSLEMGVLAVSVAVSQQLLALPLGLLLLTRWPWERWHPTLPAARLAPIDAWFAPAIERLAGHLSPAGLFLLGVLVVVSSFKLFDRALPELRLGAEGPSGLEGLTKRPWLMFALGGLVTLISMSVSVSLGLLVPLNLHRSLRRRRIVPYILGANVSTYSDTVLAALLVGHPEALPLVLIEILSLLVASALLLALARKGYIGAVVAFADRALARPQELALLVLAMLLLPILLLSI